MSTTATTETRTKGTTAVFTDRARRNFSGDGQQFKAGDLVDASTWPNRQVLIATGYLAPLNVDAAVLARHQAARVRTLLAEVDAAEKATRDGVVELGKEEARQLARLVEIEKIVAEGEQIRRRLVGIRDERNGAERTLSETIPQERARLQRIGDEAAATLESLA